MAAVLRASRQLTKQSGSVSITWPTGTVAGDLGVLVTRGTSSAGSGWVGVAIGNITAWYKVLTSSDLAAALTVRGAVTALQTFVGASSIGQHRHNGVTLATAGAGVLLLGENPPPATSVPPTGDRLGTPVVADGWANQIFWLPRTVVGYVELSGRDDEASYAAWEILPPPGPSAPTLSAPAAGAQADTADPVTFDWANNSPHAQEQVKVRVRPWTVGNTGTWQWVQAAGTWTTTDTALTQSASTLTLNSGVLTTGTLYEWTAATYDSGAWSPYATPQQVTAVAKPTVSSVTVSSPAESLSPVVSWSATASVGSLTAWQAAIATTAADPGLPVWASGMHPGAGAVTAAPSSSAWVNGQTLYAYVRVMQSGGLWSSWTRSSSFTVSWTPPAAPSSVTPANVTGAPLAVTVAGITSGLGVQVQASVGGTTWTLVKDDAAPGTSKVLPIPLAGYAIAAYYRARTYDVIDGISLYSAWTTSAAVASTCTGAYLVDDTDRTSYLAVELAEDSTRKLVQGVSVTYGFGAAKPRVDRGPAQGEAGSTSLLTLTLAERAAVVTWLTGHDVWWLRWPPERGAATVDVPATRMALAAGVAWDRHVQADVSTRQVAFPWVEQ